MTATQTQITADTITDDQIEELMAEAGAHGDEEQADICRLALGRRTVRAWNMTPYGARIRCAAVIAEAQAAAE